MGHITGVESLVMVWDVKMMSILISAPVFLIPWN
jgi:hypothetical protein